jgi:hypothetical protein
MILMMGELKASHRSKMKHPLGKVAVWKLGGESVIYWIK